MYVLLVIHESSSHVSAVTKMVQGRSGFVVFGGSMLFTHSLSSVHFVFDIDSDGYRTIVPSAVIWKGLICELSGRPRHDN
jgi:hypothetical protein